MARLDRSVAARALRVVAALFACVLSVANLGVGAADARSLPERIYFQRFVDHGTRAVAEWAPARGGPSHRLPIPDGDNMTTPTVSPDGSTILFTTTKGTLNHWLPRGTWIARPDGSRARRVDPGNAAARCPAWNPDGASFIQLVGGDTEPRTLQLVEMKGGGNRDLDVGSTRIGCATFLNPNTILYQRENATGSVELWQAALSSPQSTQSAISIPGCNLGTAQVSPDNLLIAFQTGCTDASAKGLYVVPTTGGTPRKLVQGPITGMSWSPDAKSLAYGFSPAPTPNTSIDIRTLQLTTGTTRVFQRHATIPSWAATG